ncbi:membrane protein insertion efficiency factor YidD [Patescibacteria group bacterium]|nr:membrane protein insertion efficiency factor YidD [Patescibacteria group bacterium]
MTVFPNQNFMLSMIDFHKKRTSPVLNKHNFKCGFTPSCSEYSKIAIKKYGAFKGGLKSLWRLARCNPLNKNKGIEYP